MGEEVFIEGRWYRKGRGGAGKWEDVDTRGGEEGIEEGREAGV